MSVHQPKHRGTIRISDVIHYLFMLNIGLASGITFCLFAEILQALARQS